jgi:S1-C subfamily serine protease
MKKVLVVIFAAAVLAGFVPAVAAQNLEDIFRRVSPSVVVVRSKGRDVSAGGVTRFNETGSGVLISDSGRVMTAAHVVRYLAPATRARDSGHAGGVAG